MFADDTKKTRWDYDYRGRCEDASRGHGQAGEVGENMARLTQCGKMGGHTLWYAKQKSGVFVTW